MNIHSQLPSFQQLQTKSYKNTGEFAGLIDEPKHSGDEYYRQHQNQLQQSELQFNAADMVQAKRFIQTDTSNVDTISVLIEKKDISTSPLPLSSPTPLPCEPQTKIDLQQSPLKAAQHNARPFALPIGQIKQAVELSEAVQKQEPEALSLAYKQELKKHHLFIKQDDAELTLNTQDLKPEEEQEFIPLIKNYLKNKGLLLKKLIINGVHHD